MADVIPLQLVVTPTTPVYCIIRNSAGLIWNTSTFVSYSTSAFNSGTYQLVMTVQGSASNYYTVAFPAGIATSGVYVVTYYQQASSSPATYSEASDTPVQAGAINWTGSKIYNPSAGGASGMTLSTATFTPTVSSTPTTTADTLITNNSGDYAIDFTAPANSAMTWQLYVRRASGAPGVLVAQNSQSRDVAGNNWQAGIPIGQLTQYQVESNITGYSYYFVVTSTSVTGSAATINCVS